METTLGGVDGTTIIYDSQTVTFTEERDSNMTGATYTICSFSAKTELIISDSSWSGSIVQPAAYISTWVGSSKIQYARLTVTGGVSKLH
jgi:hypothetical protein